MEPIEPNKTKVTIIIELSLGGSIPQKIANTVNKNQGYIIDKIKPVVAKYKKD